MEIIAEEAARMEAYLGEIADKRRQWGHLLHKLTDVLVIGITMTVAGMPEFEAMEEFDHARESLFRQFLELPNGIPDDGENFVFATFACVFARINPAELTRCLHNWLV